MSLIHGFVDLLASSPSYESLATVQSEYLACFVLPKPYPVRLDLYIDHFLYQLGISEEILVYSYMTLEEILNSGLITKCNVHKILFTALCLSYKFTISIWISNSMLEKLGGLRKGELPRLETQLLRFLNWRLKFKPYSKAYSVMQQAALAHQLPGISQESEEEEEIIPVAEHHACYFSELEGFFTFE